VSDLIKGKRRGSTAACPQCRTTVDEVVSIAPVAGEPGLIAYECPNCRHVPSMLTPFGQKTGTDPPLLVLMLGERDTMKVDHS
jgi:hypothetical protein